MSFALRCSIILFYFLFQLSNSFSQKFELGVPPITNYTPKEYKLDNQNWAVEQDLLGTIFIGNNAGLLYYDGNEWESIKIANKIRMRSLAKDTDGKIYVGSEGEFGFLEPNQKGTLIYHSLSKTLPKNEKDFLEVWSTIVIKSNIYFCTKFAVYKFNNNKLKAIYKPNKDNYFHKFFSVDDILFIRENGKGILKENNNALVLIDGGELFSDTKVDVLINTYNGLFIGTRQDGFYIQNINNKLSKKFEKLKIEAQNIYNNNTELYCGIKLKNGDIALGTFQNGVFIIDVSGNILQHINKEKGLNDNKVHSIFEDLNQNIWVALDKGISMIEHNSPFVKFNEVLGLEGNVNSFVKHKKYFYASTSQGIYYLPTNYKSNQKFEPLILNNEGYSLITFDANGNNILLASTKNGLFIIDATNASLIDENQYFSLHQPQSSKQFLFAGGAGVLAKYIFNNNKFNLQANYTNVNGEIRTIVSNESNVYAGSENIGIYNTPINNNYETISSMVTPDLKFVSKYCLFNLNNKIGFGTSSGFYKFNDNEKPAVRLFKTNNQFNDKYFDVMKATMDYDNNLWFLYFQNGQQSEVGCIKSLNTETPKFDNHLFKPLKSIVIKDFYFEENGIKWFSTNDGLFKFDFSKSKHSKPNFITRITSVKTPFKSTLFSGFYYVDKKGNNIISTKQPSELISEIEYSKNSLQFHYSATCYNYKSEVYYSSFLKNFDDGYTDWTKETKREITNLHEGKYTFCIKAKDIYDNVSSVSEYSFIIKAPWYRTIWSYISYIIIIIYFMYLIVKLNTQRLKTKNELLEKTVHERTKEIEKQKDELLDKNKEITDSINYAKIIQNAILPQEITIRDYFADNFFIYFKPRNVVSGDFYWFSEIDGKAFISVADCTGHGVPGAFMSMIGMEKLSQATKEITSLNVSDILSFINVGVKKSLGQDIENHSSKDGMEIALCEFDLTNKIVNFAGANRPLWLFRNENNNTEVITYKPTKAGIASSTEMNQVFEAHKINLHKNDCVYMFSDGAPDQFGGKRGKKLMTTGLREMLLKIQHLSMMEQKNYIENFYENWMQGFEQVDDVLIIGIKIV